MGVLYSLSQPNMLQTLRRSGLTHLTGHHLGKILEAAVLESTRRDRSLLLTGLDMQTREADGRRTGYAEPLLWTDWAEFSHLQMYKGFTAESEKDGRQAPVKEQVAIARRHGGEERVREVVREAFVGFLEGLLGREVDTGRSLSVYGVDSLGAVACRYWLMKGR